MDFFHVIWHVHHIWSNSVILDPTTSVLTSAFYYKWSDIFRVQFRFVMVWVGLYRYKLKYYHIMMKIPSITVNTACVFCLKNFELV